MDPNRPPPPPRPRAYSYIRMSTDIQLKGDSRRRQMELSQRYADQHGLELVEDRQLEDIGVSAFKGANVTGGQLGLFLKAVEEKKIERGSYLLVESLDRISRQDVRKSLTLFLQIIGAGINIATLGDGRLYTPDGTDEIDLMMSLMILSRAHDESRTKSQRVRAAWANKRTNAAIRKLTKICPMWLKLSPDKKSFEVLEDRAEVVRSMFEDMAAGIGNYSITRRLNERGVPTFGKSRGWHNSYVAKILANRAVLGEFQLHRLVDGKRVSDGEPIRDYFPAIVDQQLFYRAESGRSQRRVRGAGRKGRFVSNIFSGIAMCA